MPPLPSVRTPALAALVTDLRRSPRRRLLEQIDRAEALAADIAPDTDYPIDFLTFRLTGYRPDSRATPSVVSGADLLADLSAIVEHLCSAAHLAHDDLPEGTLDVEQLLDRWSVSRKTLDRARRRGLIARRIKGDTRGRLAFTTAAIESYERRTGPDLERAAGFRRLDAAEHARVLRWAQRYRTRFACSLSAAAERIAGRTGRSHEGVRALLARHDAHERTKPDGLPIFPAPARRDRTARFALLRAARDGAEPAELAELAGAEPRAAQRMIAGLRLEMLRRLDLAGPTSPVFGRDDATTVLLGPDLVRTGLGLAAATPPGKTLREQIDLAQATRPGSADVETARSTALAFLRARAAAALADVRGKTTKGETLDAIETDLRWATRLRAALLRDQFGSIVRSLQEVVGPLDRLGTAETNAVLRVGCSAARRAIDPHPPWRGARLAAAVTLAVARSVPRLNDRSTERPAHADGPAHGRAARRVSADAGPIDPGRLAMTPTEAALLDLDETVRRAWVDHRDRFDPAAHRALGRRHGFDDSGPPLTFNGLGTELGTTRMWAARRVRAAIRDAIGLSRGGDANPKR